MAFTFPQDSNNKAGAVKPTSNGSDFYVPTREQGSESIIGAIVTITTNGTATQLPSATTREVTVIALDTNTGYIYLGGSNVSSTNYGAKLSAKDSITLRVSNANLIYITSSVDGEGVSYVAI
jgi:hypothetical protein